MPPTPPNRMDCPKNADTVRVNAISTARHYAAIENIETRRAFRDPLKPILHSPENW